MPLTGEHLATVRTEVFESVREAGLAIDTSINKSDVMKAGRAGALKLVVGLVISGGAGTPAVAVDAGRAGGKKLAESAFSKVRQKPLAGSIERHTVLFATSS